MVLAEKNNSNLKNGQRSRGPSPNGNGPSPVSPMDEEREKIRVGRDYQAICPEYVATNERDKNAHRDMNDRALLVWSPSKDISDDQLDEYIQIAKEKYGYNGEQALGMLFWHKHDLEKAVMDLANFTPFPDEWTVEDKVLFEQAFTFHGKTFHRIRQMLPDKSMGSLVKYYYSWKKTRTRTSLMDRQARKLAGVKEETSELGSEQGSNTDSEGEEKVQSNKQSLSGLKRKLTDSIDDLRPAESLAKANARWSNEELTLAVQGVRKYGKNFKAIADIIGTKTESHVRNFFVTYKKRYNLDVVLKEYEAENGLVIDISEEKEEKKEEKMEVEETPPSDPAIASPVLAVQGHRAGLPAGNASK